MELIAQAIDTEVIAKGLIIGLGGLGPAIGIGIMGAAYMNAVSRNPEAAKFLSTLFIFIGMAEFFGIVAIGAFFIV